MCMYVNILTYVCYLSHVVALFLTRNTPVPTSSLISSLFFKEKHHRLYGTVPVLYNPILNDWHSIIIVTFSCHDTFLFQHNKIFSSFWNSTISKKREIVCRRKIESITEVIFCRIEKIDEMLFYYKRLLPRMIACANMNTP